MGELNPDRIERASFPEEPSPELIQILSARRKIIARNLYGHKIRDYEGCGFILWQISISNT